MMELTDQKAVAVALGRWRNGVLDWLGKELRTASQDRVAAEDGLAIAHRNPGEVDDDVIAIIWDRLESASIREGRLDRNITAIEAMTFPELLILFSRTTKLKTWPWQGDRWELPDLNF